MAVFANLKIIGGIISKTSIFFLTRLRFTFMLMLFLFLIINAIIISIESGNPQDGIMDIGKRIALATNELQTESQSIIDKGEIYTEDTNLFSKFFLVFKVYFRMIMSILTIAAWIYVFYWISSKFIISNTSAPFPSILVALIIFFLLQILFLLGSMGLGIIEITVKDAFIIPIKAFYTFFKAIPLLFLPFRDILTGFSGQDDVMVGSNLSNLVRNYT